LTTSFSEKDVHTFFDSREAELTAPASRTPFEFTADFRKALPTKGGVYVVFHERDVIYVGETTSLRHRLGVHMRNPENHVLALKLARLLYDKANGNGSAGSTRKFKESHKAATREWIRQNLSVSYVHLPIGRKELEERLVGKYDPEFNKRYPQLP
jgi:predicted GIY-YIG superfamily endonuclease